MKSLCVITIQLNTLTDVPYEMTVGGAFVYVCERDRVKDFVYITRSVIMELQCNLLTPLAHVRLSKHQTTKTTTMYRSLRIERNGIYPTYLDRYGN